MKRSVWLLCWMTLTAVAMARGPLASRSKTETPNQAHRLPVLCYHEVDPHPMDEMTVTPHEFESHMDYLRRSGYTPVTLQEANLFYWAAKKLYGKPILITFDDGYPGVYKYALPILEHYNFCASLFLVVGMVDTPGHLTLEELKKLQASGLFEFGSHTYNLHTHIAKRLAEGGVFPDQVLRDLKQSRSELQRMLGVDATAFAWPHGTWDDTCLQLAGRAGFKMQFTIDYGSTRFGEGSLRIRRVILHGSDFAPHNFKGIIDNLPTT